MSFHRPQMWSWNTILLYKKPGFIGKWLIPSLGQETRKMNQEDLVIPDSQEAIKD